jgi:NADPH:quinone reductase-like Zn-dependent oxidoreductase
MRAIVLEKFGGLDSLVYKDIPEPEPKAGHVVIHIKAFGINHAEMHMRRGEWAEAVAVSGIECVGIVKSCPGGEFPVGAKVAALMGGLGRTINGSYAEYTRAPVSNVALIESDLSWAELATSGVYLTFFGSFVLGTPGFPLSDVPLQDIARQVAEGKLRAKPARVKRIASWRLMEPSAKWS